MARAPWQSPRILYTLLFVFLSGAAAGALAMKFSSVPGRHAKAGPWWKEGAREISLQKFRNELDLTNDQAREMETVLDDFMMYYQTLQAQMDEVRASGKDRIVKILNAEQREKFGRMMSELQTRQIR